MPAHRRGEGCGLVMSGAFQCGACMSGVNPKADSCIFIGRCSKVELLGWSWAHVARQALNFTASGPTVMRECAFRNVSCSAVATLYLLEKKAAPHFHRPCSLLQSVVNRRCGLSHSPLTSWSCRADGRAFGHCAVGCAALPLSYDTFVGCPVLMRKMLQELPCFRKCRLVNRPVGSTGQRGIENHLCTPSNGDQSGFAAGALDAIPTPGESGLRKPALQDLLATCRADGRGRTGLLLARLSAQKAAALAFGELHSHHSIAWGLLEADHRMLPKDLQPPGGSIRDAQIILALLKVPQPSEGGEGVLGVLGVPGIDYVRSEN